MKDADAQLVANSIDLLIRSHIISQMSKLLKCTPEQQAEDKASAESSRDMLESILRSIP